MALIPSSGTMVRIPGFQTEPIDFRKSIHYDMEKNLRLYHPDIEEWLNACGESNRLYRKISQTGELQLYILFTKSSNATLFKLIWL